MKTKIFSVTSRVSLFSWKSPVLTNSLVLLSICFLIYSVLNGEEMGDVVLCFGPLFSGLKEKMTKGLNKLNSLIEDEDGDDVLDKKLDRLEERFEKSIDMERKLDEWERKKREKEAERERKKEEEEEERRKEVEEEDIEDVWKRRIAEKYARGEKLTPREQFALELIQENEELRLTEEEKEESRKRWEAEIVAKYERGEELTPNEKKALELIMENEQIELEMQQREAEYEAKMEAEKEAKKQKRKEMFSKVGKAIASIGANSSSANGPATNNSQGGSSTQKKVAKVWGMKYVGPKDNRAPGGIINVPSGNQTGRPTTSEIREALQSLGYSSADASALAGPDSWWKAV